MRTFGLHEDWQRDTSSHPGTVSAASGLFCSFLISRSRGGAQMMISLFDDELLFVHAVWILEWIFVVDRVYVWRTSEVESIGYSSMRHVGGEERKRILSNDNIQPCIRGQDFVTDGQLFKVAAFMMESMKFSLISTGIAVGLSEHVARIVRISQLREGLLNGRLLIEERRTIRQTLDRTSQFYQTTRNTYVCNNHSSSNIVDWLSSVWIFVWFGRWCAVVSNRYD